MTIVHNHPLVYCLVTCFIQFFYRYYALDTCPAAGESVGIDLSHDVAQIVKD